MDVTRMIIYRGPAARASALAQMLQEEGVRVEWTPPQEQRGLGTDIAVGVLVQIMAAGGYDAIKAGVDRFRKRFPRAEVEIEDEDGGDHPEDEEPR